DIDKNSNHKKQILDICQVIIFISQYSTQLRLDKQESYATTIGSLPANIFSHSLYRESRWLSSMGWLKIFLTISS
ncbi:MAG: hypothetical protein ACKPGT_25710, partial [Microcystis sp.]